MAWDGGPTHKSISYRSALIVRTNDITYSLLGIYCTITSDIRSIPRTRIEKVSDFGVEHAENIPGLPRSDSRARVIEGYLLDAQEEEGRICQRNR